MKRVIDGVEQDVDMSSAGIDRRLQDLGQLFRLALALGEARRVGPTETSSLPPARGASPQRPAGGSR